MSLFQLLFVATLLILVVISWLYFAKSTTSERKAEQVHNETGFSAVWGLTAQQAGVAAAAFKRAAILIRARDIAVRLGRVGSVVTADDVYATLIGTGHDINQLGPAAGSIFRNKNWKFTGTWQQSTRTSNHARLNRVWQYVGE